MRAERDIQKDVRDTILAVAALGAIGYTGYRVAHYINGTGLTPPALTERQKQDKVEDAIKTLGCRRIPPDGNKLDCAPLQSSER